MADAPFPPPFTQIPVPTAGTQPVQPGIPTAPPAQSPTHHAPFPGVQYDSSGRSWFRGPDGTWFGSQPFSPSSGLSSSSQAQTTQPPYNAFGPAPANRVPNHLIDPRLLPLPEDNDSDFDPLTVAKLRGLKPATKVAGVRQMDKKGKKRARSSDCDNSDDSDAAPAPKQRGRPKGSTNFNGCDVDKLLDISEELLPLAANGWKKLVKTKKPTGDPDSPPEVKQAKLIDRKINERVGMQDLGDSEFGSNVSSDDSIEVLESHDKKLHSAVAHRAPTPPLPRKSRLNPPELVTKLAKAFDPETQRSMQEERSQWSFQTTQLLSLTQQLRDANAATDALRNQLTQMQTRLHEAERARDRAKFKLEFYGPAPGGERLSRRGQYIAEQYPDLIRVRGKIRNTSAGDDSDKENWDPSSSSADDSGAGAEAH
ncbi:hypothetical protein MSAN_01681400 [Mycena sanguinolenta]|uniref:Uncharacterized protein n=1 Tax=Mycena sanguinolenta TaxID=230812 RepID=A0A8H6XWK9_9AGAR|nr:hypothetical protein MSAN_01681400 [Mycena sanguinolenta]